LSGFPCRFHSTGAPLIVKIDKKLLVLIIFIGVAQKALRLRCEGPSLKKTFMVIQDNRSKQQITFVSKGKTFVNKHLKHPEFEINMFHLRQKSAGDWITK
jgi:hypothetical protein